IFTVLHAGGKFGQGGYKASGGLHGVGAAVVNALSEFLEVTTSRNGETYIQKFLDGGRNVTELRKVGTSRKSGTTIHVKPDSEIFSTTEIKFETISERLREAAFLFPNLKITLIDERTGIEEIYQYADALISFVHYLNEGKDVLHDVVSFSGEQDGIELDFAFQFTESYVETIHSFVNHVRTKDGGTHEVGAKTAFTRTFNDYARRNDML